MGISNIYRAAASAGFILVAGWPALVVGQVVVKGVLYDDASGQVLRGTVMLIDPATDSPVVHVTTDSAGQFTLQGGRGTYQLAAVRGGYSSVLSAPIPLMDGERLTVRVPMAVDGDPQHQIAVTEHVRPNQAAMKAAEAARTPLADGRYQARKALGTGLHFERPALSGLKMQTVGEFLMNVQGINVEDPGSTSSMQMSRSAGINAMARVSTVGTCHIGWFLDGRRIDLAGRSDPITDGLASMQLDAVEALEVFRGVSEMPPEFAAPDLRCGAVAIWTRRG